jgi:hypothetical protein
MNEEPAAIRYCDHCGLPLDRCQQLGGEDWHRLWDETVDGLVNALRKRLADEGEEEEEA